MGNKSIAIRDDRLVDRGDIFGRSPVLFWSGLGCKNLINMPVKKLKKKIENEKLLRLSGLQNIIFSNLCIKFRIKCGAHSYSDVQRKLKYAHVLSAVNVSRKVDRFLVVSYIVIMASPLNKETCKVCNMQCTRDQLCVCLYLIASTFRTSNYFSII